MRRQEGVTLVEVLIALALLAFGLIGIAAIQLTSLQSAASGYQYSVASVAALDAQERAWAQLAAKQNCRHLTAGLESDWQAEWFTPSQAPLNGATGTVDSAFVSGGCQLTVSITMRARSSNQAADHFDYVFTLPFIEARYAGEAPNAQ
ncbi:MULTISPECIES: prepilin-type N-terminal cleavage/methylation domain-containing protein [Halomonas]|uniref:Prepilin-type N-terminal cleavage/methylation domain-containing protein n=1 Tax=Halomonas citrativorans TaxID=2742612 RepID=A0ABR9FFM7_9GAMM|nr:MULTISPECIES: prepilin-type N-terminal cleavage/methylation domain-containing protein [Halomonas]MBE0404839.1 prepilin-type N-terminal cleavage/methylation domain-containing protein [Halomonas citrativorans]